MLVCLAFEFIFHHMLTFIRYIEVNSTFALADIVFVITRISLNLGSLNRGSVPYILL